MTDLQYTRHHLKVLEFTHFSKNQGQETEAFLQRLFSVFGRIRSITSLVAIPPGTSTGSNSSEPPQGLHMGYVIHFRRPKRVQSDPKAQTFYTQMSVPEQILRKVLQGTDARDGEEYKRAAEGYTFLNGCSCFADVATAKNVARGHVFSGYNRFLVEGRTDKFEGDSAAEEENDSEEDDNAADGAEGGAQGLSTTDTANASASANDANSRSRSGLPKEARTYYVPSAPPASMFLCFAPMAVPSDIASSVPLPTISPYAIFQILRHLCVPRKILILNHQERDGPVQKALVELSNVGEMSMVCDRLDRTEVELCEDEECLAPTSGRGDYQPDYTEQIINGTAPHVPPTRTVVAAKYFVSASPSMQHESKGLSVTQNTGRTMAVATKLPSLFMPPIDSLPAMPTVISTAEALGPAFDRTMSPMCPLMGPYAPQVHHCSSFRKYVDQYSQDESRRHEHWKNWQQQQRSKREGDASVDPEDTPNLPHVPEPSYDTYDPLCLPGREDDLRQAIRDLRHFILKAKRKQVPEGKNIPPSRITIGGHVLAALPIPSTATGSKQQLELGASYSSPIATPHQSMSAYPGDLGSSRSLFVGDGPLNDSISNVPVPLRNSTGGISVVVGLAPPATKKARHEMDAHSSAGKAPAPMASLLPGLTTEGNADVLSFSHLMASGGIEASPSTTTKPAAAWEEYYDETHAQPYYCLRSLTDDTVLETTWERPAELHKSHGQRDLRTSLGTSRSNVARDRDRNASSASGYRRDDHDRRDLEYDDRSDDRDRRDDRDNRNRDSRRDSRRDEDRDRRGDRERRDDRDRRDRRDDTRRSTGNLNTSTSSTGFGGGRHIRK